MDLIMIQILELSLFKPQVIFDKFEVNCVTENIYLVRN